MKKQKYILFLSLKLLVVFLACRYIYAETFQNKNFEELKNFLPGIFNSSQHILYLLPALLMVFLNWGAEALKWKFVINKIEKISFAKSFIAVLSGVTVSVFTPNRIGEYVGRVFYLEKSDKIQAALITVLGSLSQLLATLIFGSAALLFFLSQYQPESFFNNYVFSLIVVIVTLINVLSVILFLFTPSMSVLLHKFSFLHRFKKYSDVFSYYSPGELLTVLLLSGIRYMVFSVQFFFLLKLFNVEIALLQAMVLIPLVFLAVTVVPTITPSEIGVREFFALQFIGVVSANSLGIVSSTFTLWLINLALPAIIGAFFILRMKFFKNGMKSL